MLKSAWSARPYKRVLKALCFVASGLSDPYCLLGIQPGSTNNNNNINNNSNNNNGEKISDKEKGGGDRKLLRLNTTPMGSPWGSPWGVPPGPGSPLIASPVGLVAGTIGEC